MRTALAYREARRNTTTAGLFYTQSKVSPPSTQPRGAFCGSRTAIGEMIVYRQLERLCGLPHQRMVLTHSRYCWRSPKRGEIGAKCDHHPALLLRPYVDVTTSPAVSSLSKGQTDVALSTDDM